jgi:hypothetical protein
MRELSTMRYLSTTEDSVCFASSVVESFIPQRMAQR